MTKEQTNEIKKYVNQYKDSPKDCQWVYLINCNEFHKIGIAGSLENRLNSLQSGNPYELKLIWAVKTYDVGEIEDLMHTKFFSKRVFREWFKLDESDIEFIVNSSK